MRLWKKLLAAAALLVVIGIGGFTWMIGGPRMLIGMLRYDQREERTLKVGDHAPDVAMLELDGKTTVHLADRLGGKLTVLVFGSFT